LRLAVTHAQAGAGSAIHKQRKDAENLEQRGEGSADPMADTAAAGTQRNDGQGAALRYHECFHETKFRKIKIGAV
jgi:hypothetical protein